MFVLLFGPPAAGKGTQAEAASGFLGVPQVSTGDIFRKNLKEGTPLGLRAREFMDRGELVPDQLVAEIAGDRLACQDCAQGALLDGFPRSLSQALFLDSFLEARRQKVGLVLNLEIPDEEVIRRMSGRRSCLHCGATYHVLSKPPRSTGICDRCAREVVQRADDHEDTVRNRLVGYHSLTAPILDHYRARGVVVDIDGLRSIEAVQVSVIEALRAIRESRHHTA
jgi:adenylate kinase